MRLEVIVNRVINLVGVDNSATNNPFPFPGRVATTMEALQRRESLISSWYLWLPSDPKYMNHGIHDKTHLATMSQYHTYVRAGANISSLTYQIHAVGGRGNEPYFDTLVAR